MSDEVVEVVEDGGGGSIADDPIEPAPAADDGADSGRITEEGDGGAGEGAETDKPVGKDEPAEPEAYELTAPEGFNIPAENLKAFQAAALKAGLSKEQAEAMMGWHKEYADAVAKAQEAETKRVYSEWDKEVMADPEIGGGKYKEGLAYGRKGVSFCEELSPGYREFLRETGADRNPHVRRLMAWLGKQNSEHGLVGGGHGKPDRASLPLHERLYPSK